MTVSELQAVRSSNHNRYCWLPYNHYRFAEKDAYAPLVIHEFKNASTMAPIAFTKEDEGYRPTLMMGLELGANLLVSESGNWLGAYVPAYYRSHPFCMAKNQHGNTLLCFRSDSEFVLESPKLGIESKPFFIGGEPSEDLRAIKSFLDRVEANRLATAKFCTLCDEMELFVPWDAKVLSGGKNISIQGLYCIDELKLRELTAEQAKAFLNSGVMGAIYYHLASLQLTSALANLRLRRDSEETKEAGVVPEELVSGSHDSDSINFDW